MQFERISETAYFNPEKNTVITVEFNALKINGQTVKTYLSPAEAQSDLSRRIAMWNAAENTRQKRFY